VKFHIEDSRNYHPVEIDVEVTVSAPFIARIYAADNSIALQNLLNNTKAQIYNLKGERIHSIQAKGIYIAKIGSQTVRFLVK